MFPNKILRYNCILSQFLRNYNQGIEVLYGYSKFLGQLYFALECIHAFIQDSTSFFFELFYTLGAVELVMLAQISSRHKCIPRPRHPPPVFKPVLETYGARWSGNLRAVQKA